MSPRSYFHNIYMCEKPPLSWVAVNNPNRLTEITKAVNFLTTRCIMSNEINFIVLNSTTFPFISASNGGSELFLSTNDKPDGKTMITTVDGGFPTDQYEYDRCENKLYSTFTTSFLASLIPA